MSGAAEDTALKPMSLLTHLECSGCGAREDASRLRGFCVACDSPLLARYDLETARHVVARTDLASRPRSLWRIRELMPPAAPGEIVTLGEADTPMLRAPALEALAAHEGILIKEESLNPTLSFKARGMAAAVTSARRLGAKRLAVPTSGNAGGALAAYAARAGLPALVIVPEGAPPAFAAEARRHGAQVELVSGHIGDAAARLAERCDEGWFDLSTFKEPYRVEGKKSLGFEIVEALGFRYPDWIVYPTGGGTGLVGMWKAFGELEALGWVSGRRPRMVAVQAQGCAPVVDAFASGAEAPVPPEASSTYAWGLRVPKPFAGRLILAALRESEGDAIAVSDPEMAAAADELAAREGIDACPEGGAVWAATKALVKRGRIAAGETVVLFNTGAGIKYREHRR